MDLATLKARLRKAFEDSGRQQKDVYTAAGVGKTPFRNWVYEETEPTVMGLAAVARELGVSLDYLVGLTDDPRILPKGQIILDPSMLERVMRATSYAEIAHLEDKNNPVVVGFEVPHNAQLPPREEAKRLIAEASAHIKRLPLRPKRARWFGKGERET